jgi:hypothetical protein
MEDWHEGIPAIGVKSPCKAKLAGTRKLRTSFFEAFALNQMDDCRPLFHGEKMDSCMEHA